MASSMMNSRGVYPRVGGGNFGMVVRPIVAGGLSPRGRGKLHYRYSGDRRARVYPRVGGGNFPPTSSSSSPVGLSPRGRGKRAVRPPPCRRRRSIPAWAGETRGKYR